MREPWTTCWRTGALLLCAILALGAGGASGIPPAEQLRRLEETGLVQARKTVEAKEELLPFAFFVRDDGRTQRLTAKKPRRGSRSDASAPLIEELHSRAEAGTCRAAAVFRFVVITLPDGEKTHAIHAGMEHASGNCTEVFLPYHETKKHEVRFDPPMRRSRSPEIFPHCDPLQESKP